MIYVSIINIRIIIETQKAFLIFMIIFIILLYM